jgi:hypothetical protein
MGAKSIFLKYEEIDPPAHPAKLFLCGKNATDFPSRIILYTKAVSGN